MKLILAILTLLSPNLGLASPFELRELYLTAKHFKSGSRVFDYDNAMLENREVGMEIDLDFNVNILKYGYWNNHVWSIVDRWEDTQKMGWFRNVGWNWRLGVRPCPWLEVGWWHFSKHMLDAQYSSHVNDGKFPVEDSIEVRLWLYRNP